MASLSPATLRRHLAVLVECGLIIRRDSPNGKRFARKGRGGQVEQAYGFDLSPLVARAAEFEAMAARSASPIWSTSSTSVPSAPMARATGSNKNLHAWPHRRPLMYRIFMPDASPAAIAVALPHGVSYCWDAGTCSLRYAWIGGFVDPMPVWKGNGNGLAKIIGNKFYAAPKDFPISATSAFNRVQFKGYRKIKGHPEFHYTIDDIDVYERITGLPSGMGLTRHFRLPDINYPLRITIGPGNTKVSKGKINQGVATLTSVEAKSFTITHHHAHGK